MAASESVRHPICEVDPLVWPCGATLRIVALMTEWPSCLVLSGSCRCPTAKVMQQIMDTLGR